MAAGESYGPIITDMAGELGIDTGSITMGPMSLMYKATLQLEKPALAKPELVLKPHGSA